ncbi:unnamed protein product [Schistosoma margrebowiei]|uniref:Uncharacterized protein n=1 Tax=Schistosoma margrebowiei TaxID=48269 RepID=A0A183N136_9TREM|nr:unnamed protein product [Schistosoma margrebowiei]
MLLLCFKFLSQQIFLWSGKVLGDGYYWPVVKGCTQYDLTLEQIYQKRLKQKIQRTFKITQNYDGSRCMCFRYGCLTAIRSPCFEEPRIPVRVGDALMVTRGTKISVVWCDHRGLEKNLGYWIYGHLVPSESCSADFSDSVRIRGWVPRVCALEVDFKHRNDKFSLKND